MSLNWTNRPFFFPTVTLLSIPGFIERLCKLATRKVSEATGANFLQELEDWYTWLDNALVLDALMQMATEEPEQSSTGEKKGIYDTANSWLHSRELLIIHLDMFFLFFCCFFSLLTYRVVRWEFSGYQPSETSTAPVHEDCPWDYV